MKIISVDPGTEETGVAILDEQLNIKYVAKLSNLETMKFLHQHSNDHPVYIFEQFKSYGMPMGDSTIQSILWEGRMIEHCNPRKNDVFLVPRKSIVTLLCNNPKAKDTNVRQALIDLYGPAGTKKNPGKLYGVSKDMWSALAIGIVFIKYFKDNQDKFTRL